MHKQKTNIPTLQKIADFFSGRYFRMPKIVKNAFEYAEFQEKMIQFILCNDSNRSMYFLETNEALLTHTTLRPLTALPVKMDAKDELY